MKRFYFYIILISSISFFLSVSARTNCDLQPKPALSCPTGYSVMCISTGGDHWGCGKEDRGQIVEWTPSSDSSETNTTSNTDNTIYQNNQSDLNFKQQQPPTSEQPAAPESNDAITTTPDTGITNGVTTDQNTQQPPPGPKTEPAPKNYQPAGSSESSLPPETAINQVLGGNSSGAPIATSVAVVVVLGFFSWLWWRKWLKRKKTFYP